MIITSKNHRIALATMVPAMMPRKRIRQVGKRSCGLTPRVYAKELIPCVALSGRVNKVLVIDLSMNRTDWESAI